MPLHFPRPTRRAGYAPVQEEIKLSPQPRIAETNNTPVAKFECRIKIHAPKDSLSSLQTGVFSLAKTPEETRIQSWKKAEEIQPHRHIILTAKCFKPEQKSLICERFLNMGISQSYTLSPKPIDSEHINAEFIPFIPVVESDDRLGHAAHGYYYYFYDGQLVYEMAILGKGRSAWQITRSAPSGISQELISKHTYTTLMVPVKIEQASPAPQHIFYRRQKLTNDELAEINPAWLDENATKIDVNALVAACSEPLLGREQVNQEEAQTTRQTHTVGIKSDGKPEMWSDIAPQYGLTAKALVKLNPAYESDPMSLKVGDTLNVSEQAFFESGTLIAEQPCPQTDFTVGKAYPYGNVWGQYAKPQLSPSVLHLFEDARIPEHSPVFNVQKVQEKTLRIGVFFDGTGQNRLNDLYKESRGVKSRTNVARLFEAYPLDDDSQKTYVSGVGTVDDAWQNPTVIDEGDDESDLGQAFGVEPNRLPSASVFLAPPLNHIVNGTLELISGETGAFYKWQNWTKQYYDIIDSLVDSDEFKNITHIEFDVFGFSRGAALARHFVNAIKDGLPDYNKPRNGESYGEVFPNLLAHIDDESVEAKHGYYPDESRTCSVRFVGLFDTVGSFYQAGDNEEGNFQLDLDSKCAERVFQITAHHEYRKNFPLTSLRSNKGMLQGHFYEEAFAGCHTDIGGGYPSKHQYDKQGLPERYGMPRSATFNRELFKTESISGLFSETIRSSNPQHAQAAESRRQMLIDKEAKAWEKECRAKGRYGVLKEVNQSLYYYVYHPISNGLSALSLERMRQQGEVMGIKWQMDDYQLPQDFDVLTGSDVSLTALNNKLLAQPLGSITPEHWMAEIRQNDRDWIHRPHDTVINPGFDTLYEKTVNGVTTESNQLKRVVFTNDS
ncbi:phospholipase effector Tle1 domain-containing protein [Vibrio tetraodonis]|uniref:phospholipase effector Tle1 domain-containing protein n=1 Tax=Vibrio tetraodonis TaxID=2231647 RepID=UPI000E0BA1AD|nr:DUF2235 domain-containing protein [Vibrio tetraodonis]